MERLEITQALDVLTLMPNTKSEIASFSEQIKQQILNGEVDVKKLLFQKKYIEKTLEAIFDDPQVKSVLEDEIEKYGKDGVGYEDLKFEVGSKKTWDYSQDGEYSRLKERMKAREKFLQTVPASGMADPKTGEMIYPATFKTSSYIKSSFQK